MTTSVIAKTNQGRWKRVALFLVAGLILTAAAGAAWFQFGACPHDGVIIDFESAKDMDRVKWKCHDRFERVPAISGSGTHALLADLAAGLYPGIEIFHLPRNWNGYTRFEFTVSTPDAAGEPLHVRIDDRDVADAYTERYEGQLRLPGGAQTISIPIEEIRTGPAKRPLDLRRIRRIILYLYNRNVRSTLTIDDVHLSK